MAAKDRQQPGQIVGVVGDGAFGADQAYRARTTRSTAHRLPRSPWPGLGLHSANTRMPSRLGAVAFTSASWVARSHSGSAIRVGRPSAPRRARHDTLSPPVYYL